MNQGQEAIKDKLTVLVVDDAKVVVERFVPSLVELENVATVSYALNFGDGKTMLEARAFDVAIIDINLPDKSGMELLGLVREKKYPVKWVIMMTEEPSDQKRERCHLLGADYFFDKFEAFEDIVHLVSDLNRPR